MRASTTSLPNTPTPNGSYSPSVPISVYRELAAELQAAEGKLEALNAQNQQLVLQNQQLRQEIDKAVKYVLDIQQVVDAAGTVNQMPINTANFKPELSRPVSVPRLMHRLSQPLSPAQNAVVNPSYVPTKEAKANTKVFTEQHEEGSNRRSQLESTSEISGWWLAITILLIMVTAFSAGYFIVKPLLPSR